MGKVKEMLIEIEEEIQRSYKVGWESSQHRAHEFKRIADSFGLNFEEVDIIYGRGDWRN